MPLYSRVSAMVLVLLVISCAGSNFIRPESESLSLKQTTKQDITNKFGKPYQKGTKLTNEKTVDFVTYAYSSVGSTPVYKGITPARAMTFYFLNDLLVGYDFTSTFKEDHSDFDESKLNSIKKGETSLEDVISALGEPKGKYIFPLIEDAESEAIVYKYEQFKSYKIYNKSLIIIANQGIVTDVEYVTSGEK
jgi:hypothetical protein